MSRLFSSGGGCSACTISRMYSSCCRISASDVYDEIFRYIWTIDGRSKEMTVLFSKTKENVNLFTSGTYVGPSKVRGAGPGN